MAASSSNNDTLVLHMALRNGSNEQEVQKCLRYSTAKLWKANSVGWTGMHVAASQGSVNERWLLQRALEERCFQKKLFVDARTLSQGHTCMGLFFGRHLHPLPWHNDTVKRAAAVLRADLESIVEDTSLLNECRAWISNHNNGKDSSSSPAVSRVTDFWSRMELWLRAAYLGTLDTACDLPFIHALAYTGGSVEVMQLALKLYPEQARQSNAEGNLPLHILAERHANVALLKALLQAHPQAARCVNKEGRLPLHIALIHTNDFEFISILLKAGPRDGLRDAVTGLPPVCLAALHEASEDELAVRAMKDQGALWHFSSPRVQQRGLEQARRDVELVQLDTMYKLLRVMPESIQKRR